MSATETLTSIFTLLVLFQLKHFLADFPLQNRYMLKKFVAGWDFVPPLAAHSAIHAMLTYLICLSYSRDVNFSIKLALVDFVTHFTMDRIKAGPRYLGRFFDTAKPYFWWCLGFDQMVHHLTHYFVIYQVVVRST